MPDFNDYLKRAGVEQTQPEDLSTLRVLLHGMAGTGKTSLAATASHVEELSPVLWIDTENGSMPLRDWGDLDNITIVRVTDWPTMLKVYNSIIEAHRAGTFPYKTIVFDTIDRLQEYAVKYGEEQNPRDGFAKWTLAYSGIDSVVVTLSHQLGINMVAITHTAREENRVTGEVQLAPEFEGSKTGRKLPSLFDFVGYMDWTEDPEDEERLIPVLYTRRQGVVTKQRVKDFPPAIGNPTFEKIMKYIHQDA